MWVTDRSQDVNGDNDGQAHGTLNQLILTQWLSKSKIEKQQIQNTYLLIVLNHSMMVATQSLCLNLRNWKNTKTAKSNNCKGNTSFNYVRSKSQTPVISCKAHTTQLDVDITVVTDSTIIMTASNTCN